MGCLFSTSSKQKVLRNYFNFSIKVKVYFEPKGARINPRVRKDSKHRAENLQRTELQTKDYGLPPEKNEALAYL